MAATPGAPRPPEDETQVVAPAEPAAPPPEPKPRKAKRASARAEPQPATRKRRRDGALVGYLSGLFTFLLLLVFALGGALIYGKSAFDGEGPLERDTTVMVNRNQGLGEIADSLQRAGVIDQPRLFEFGVRMHGENGKLRYGEYAFPAHVSMREAMEIMASGKSIEHSVTLPEGLTSLQIVDRLRDQQLLTGDVRDTPPEGSLLPETYRFTRGMPRQQIIARMQEDQKETLEKIWRSRDPSNVIRTPEELVVLASIVEKETGVPEERPRVAAVFLNRLAKGMRLQSDPTIVYGIVAGRGTLGRSLTRADIVKKTPYNTYAISGLPAGPITNPGRQAMEAVANPAKTADLYFVADGTGGHAFAATLADHNRNVAKWRQVEKARGAQTDRLDSDDAAAEASNEAPTSATTPAANANSSTPPAGDDATKPADKRHKLRR